MRVYFADGPLYGQIKEVADGLPYLEVAEPPEPPKLFSAENAVPPKASAMTFKVQRYKLCADQMAGVRNVDATGYIV